MKLRLLSEGLGTYNWVPEHLIKAVSEYYADGDDLPSIVCKTGVDAPTLISFLNDFGLKRIAAEFEKDYERKKQLDIGGQKYQKKREFIVSNEFYNIILKLIMSGEMSIKEIAAFFDVKHSKIYNIFYSNKNNIPPDIYERVVWLGKHKGYIQQAQTNKLRFWHRIGRVGNPARRRAILISTAYEMAKRHKLDSDELIGILLGTAKSKGFI